MNKFINWLTSSNRLLHLQCCVAVMAILLASALVGDDIFGEKFKAFVIEAFVGTFGLSCGVEFIQKKCGNKWDWNDIIVGCSLPFIFMVAVLIFG